MKVSDELADKLSFLWLEHQDLSSLKEPQELIALYADVREKIKPHVSYTSQPKRKNGVISPGIGSDYE